jgi:hypothetical protein
LVFLTKKPEKPNIIISRSKEALHHSDADGEGEHTEQKRSR